MTMTTKPFLWLAALCSLAVFLTACQSTKQPGAGTFAHVIITNYTTAEIRRATGEVFREAGYEATVKEEYEAVFERKGSKLDTMTHGSWSFDPVWVRVKVYIDGLGLSRHLLRCDAYMVIDRGDILSEEKKVKKINRGSYQKLLNKVPEKL